MKALVFYDEKCYLVPATGAVAEEVAKCLNSDRFFDEAVTASEIKNDITVIAYFTDESEML
jgi:hypothetical protein